MSEKMSQMSVLSDSQRAVEAADAETADPIPTRLEAWTKRLEGDVIAILDKQEASILQRIRGRVARLESAMPTIDIMFSDLLSQIRTLKEAVKALERTVKQQEQHHAQEAEALS